MAGGMEGRNTSHDVGALERLAAVDTATLDDRALLEHVAAFERLIARANAGQLAALADLARRPARVAQPDDDPADVSATWRPLGRAVREFADDEVAVHLRISRQDASNRIATGCALVGLPRTREALEDGRIDLRRARVLVEETRALDSATARKVETALVATAQHLPAARLRPLVRRAVIAADSVAAAQREQLAHAERRVVVTPLPDGMAELWALLPAADAMAVKTAVSAAARASHADREAGDDRTMDQRMADALTAPFTHALESGELAGTDVKLATHRGRAAELRITISADSLSGQSEEPAELAGYGPITAATARELAPDARWRRIVTDPLTGAVLDVGDKVYRPTNAIVRHVEARSPRCAFPGCGWNAVSCDLDHIVPFPEGPTAAHNLTPLCRRHHRMKQSKQVRVEAATNEGELRWTLPTGHVELERHDLPDDP